jgi:aminoglycoside phosphotransferase (APT) family kinase protein
MDFVSRQTKIPVPKIITAFQTESGHTFVLMTRIRGKQLYGTFDEASESAQRSYLAQLRRCLEELRSIKPPEPPFVGPFDHGALEDERAFYGRIGPFQTVQDFHSALVGHFDTSLGDSEQQEREQGTAELWQSIRKIIKMQRSRPFAIKLTHGDLAFRNIIVDGGRIVGILDWEMGGWLPDYWELACTDAAFFDSEDLRPRIREFLEPFEEELAMERLRRTIFANM